jgi:hypothetical protein
MANSEAIEVVDGLEEGDEVVLNPRSELPDEIALLEQEQRLQDDTLADPAPANPTPMDEEEWRYLFEGGPEPGPRDDDRTIEESAEHTALPTGRLPETPPVTTR